MIDAKLGSAASSEDPRTERLELIGDIAAQLLMDHGDPDELIRASYARLARHLGLEVYVNYLLDEEVGRLRLQSCDGIEAPTVERLRWLDLGQAVCGTVAADGERRVVEQVQQSDDPITGFIRSIGIRAYACHPLVAQGRLIGTLSYGTRARDRFEPEELELMHTVSELAAAAFDRAALTRDLASRAEELDQLSRFRSLILDSMSQAVIATDTEHRITAWNARAEELYGWSREEAVGYSIYERTVPQMSQEQAHEIMATLSAGEAWSGEFTVERKDSSTFLARIRNAPLFDGAGRTVGVVGLSEDITEERRREQEAEAELQRRAEWLAFSSHELRSPLTSIVGYAWRLRRRARADDALAGARDELEMLLGEARRMERSVNLLLELAALDLGHVSLDREPLYLADVIEEELAAIRRSQPQANLLASEVDPHLSLVSDQNAIRLVIRNLLENGVKYGGDPPTVTLTVDANDDDRVTLAVADSGQGIPQEDLDRIFDRYFRSTEAASQGRGLGLGLHISRQLTGLLGGSLWAESPPGEGARFHLVLPRESASQE